MKGTVIWFDSIIRGYGFIEGENGISYFVHVRNVQRGLKLEPDMRVEFDEVETEKGFAAMDVRLCK